MSYYKAWFKNYTANKMPKTYNKIPCLHKNMDYKKLAKLTQILNKNNYTKKRPILQLHMNFINENGLSYTENDTFKLHFFNSQKDQQLSNFI